MSVGRTTVIVTAIAACMLFLTLGGLSLNPSTVGFLEDDAIYLSLGTSLAHHGTYRMACLPGDPLSAKYPPLYVLFLGALARVLPPPPASLALYKWATLLLAVPGLVCFAWWALRRAGVAGVPPVVAGIAAAAAGSHAYLLYFSKELMSESLFFSLFMLAVCASERREREEDTASRSTASGQPCWRSVC